VSCPSARRRAIPLGGQAKWLITLTQGNQMASEEIFDWLSFINGVYARANTDGKHKSHPVFHPSASLQEIKKCEKRLAVVFPSELKSLLLQTNGISESLNTAKGEINSGYFVLSVERILETNQSQRAQDYIMPLDCLLFFAEDGIGDYFGFAVAKSKVLDSRIYFWDHEDDSRRSIAPTLKYFIENWLLGKIKV
jgi:hypothetical protein